VSATSLVVEDDEDTRNVLLDVLTQGGFRAIGARDGLEALQKARVLHPSVILLDLQMPVMDGISFKRQQARDPDIASIPVICVSAADNAADLARGVGVADCVTKPVNFERLIELVSSHTATDDAGHQR
jgi:CheY-like chemotaxis protein